MDIDQIVSIIRESRQVRNQINSCLQSYCLSVNELELLYVLTVTKDTNPSRISTVTGQRNSSISRILRTLSDKQLIILDTNHIDRRNVSIKLTALGERLYAKVESKIQSLL